MSAPYEIVGMFAHGSPEWHAAREDGIGGSEIAAILGLSKWQSHYSLWLAKKGLMPERETNAAMTVGTYVEPAIVQWWRDQHPTFGVADLGTFRSVERPWQIANPDHLATNDDGRQVLLECKFAVHDSEWGDEGTDQIPPYYLTQVRWYMDVLGLDLAFVAVLFGGSGRFAEYVVRQDASDVALMRAQGLAFMQSIWDNERPDIDAHGATYEALRTEADGVGSGDIEVSGEVAEQYLTARSNLAHAETAMQFATNRVMGLLNDCDAKRAVHDGKPIAYRTSRSGGTPYLQASPRSKESA